MSKKAWIILITIVAAVMGDQILKIWIKTHMIIGENSHDNWGWSIKWFQIYFIENPGMAFGMQLGKGVLGKLALSLFRIVAVFGIGYYIVQLLKRRNVRFGYVVCVAFIFAGALGNILDSVFYGVIFEASNYYGNPAHLFPMHGYAPLLHGRVVDMFYFPLIKSTWPTWVPVCGGESFEFFSPIFNMADSYISVSIVVVLLFFRGEVNKQTRVRENAE